jgi:hypothetical protein
VLGCHGFYGFDKGSFEMPGTISVFVPVGEVSAAPVTAVERPDRSEFLIGMLDNHKHNTGRILDHLETRLAAQFGDVRFVRVKKPEAGKPAPAAVLEQLSECAAVVNGIGD